MAFFVETNYTIDIMRSRVSFILTVIITAVISIALYRPVSVLVFRVAEPYYGFPVKAGATGGKFVIRNDALGDGDFGTKRSGGRSHTGIDIQAAVGTPVYASKSGIAFCGNVPTGYGRYVMIYHPDGTQTMYGHLSNWAVGSTQQVRKGEMIGYVGKTGNAASRMMQPHLHFEIRIDGEPVAPQPLMR